jgi:hypothetical protein
VISVLSSKVMTPMANDPYLINAELERLRLMKEIEEREWHSPGDSLLDHLYAQLAYVEDQIRQGNIWLPTF